MNRVYRFDEYDNINEELSSNVRGDLMNLIGEGNIDKLDRYIDDNNIDVDYDSGMMLILAAKTGKLDMVKFLHNIGANLKIRRNLALKRALVFGQEEVAKYLLSNTEISDEEKENIIEYVNDSSDVATVADKKKALDLLA